MTDIFKCTCNNEFQDETYGKGMRVMNSKGGDKISGWTCTVCGRTYSINEVRK